MSTIQKNANLEKDVEHSTEKAKPYYKELQRYNSGTNDTILANSGRKSSGLLDELISFFSPMNMYLTTKTQVSDTKEYQDFLQMLTDKTKTSNYYSLMLTIQGVTNLKEEMLTSFLLRKILSPPNGSLTHDLPGAGWML